MRTLRIGLLAGHGVDGPAWMHQQPLPESFQWQYIQSADDISLIDLDSLVWLWDPTQPDDALAADAKAFLQWSSATLRVRQNRLIPILLVSTRKFEQLDHDAEQRAWQWQQTLLGKLKHACEHELKSWIPSALVDPSRVALQMAKPNEGARLTDYITRLRTTITLWQQRIHRQAERCLVAGLLMVGTCLVLLLTTIPWVPGKQLQQQPAANPLVWSQHDWQWHLTDCEKLIASLQQRSFDQLTAAEQERFLEHLRWLPVSQDLLSQRRPTREVVRLRKQVQELLQQMESRVQTWADQPAVSLVEQTARQNLLHQLLDQVFEPRKPPTVIHQAAQKYWKGERQLTLLMLREMASKDQKLEQTLGLWLAWLKEKVPQVEQCRVHAPELKTAWLVELESTIIWLEKTLAKKEPVSKEQMQLDSTPALLREAIAAKP